MKPKRPEKRERRRIGRGIGSGMGKTSTRGGKGQTARSGGGVRPGFEGGQNPYYRRMPKRGFNNSNFRVAYQILNLGDLDALVMTEITPENLVKDGIIKRNLPLKILGSGAVKKALVVKAHKFSGSAKTKIEKAGGRTEILQAK